jgi:hypothetical protein
MICTVMDAKKGGHCHAGCSSLQQLSSCELLSALLEQSIFTQPFMVVQIMYGGGPVNTL